MRTGETAVVVTHVEPSTLTSTVMFPNAAAPDGRW